MTTRNHTARWCLMFALPGPFALHQGASAAVWYWYGADPQRQQAWASPRNWGDAQGKNPNSSLPAAGDTANFTVVANALVTHDSNTDTIANLNLFVATNLTVSGGSLTVTGTENIGNGKLTVVSTPGTLATMHQVGTAGAGGELLVAAPAGSSALVVFGAGNTNNETWTTYGKEEIASTNAGGDFQQWGGTHRVAGSSGTLSIGWDGSNGTYELYLGSLVAHQIIVGDGAFEGPGGGAGLFSQYAGTNEVNTLTVGASNPGSYVLRGGSVVTQNESIGFLAGSTFNQYGGSNTASGKLTVAVRLP